MARLALNYYMYAIFIFDRQNLNLMKIYTLNTLFLTPIFTRDENGHLVLLLSSCYNSYIMKVDETKSDYFSDGISCTYTFNSFNLYFAMLICCFIVYRITLNDTKTNVVKEICKRITGVAVSENQEVYYSITIYDQNFLFQNYISTSIFKTNSILRSSKCSSFSISYKSNKLTSESLDLNKSKNIIFAIHY